MKTIYKMVKTCEELKKRMVSTVGSVWIQVIERILLSTKETIKDKEHYMIFDVNIKEIMAKRS